MMTGRFAPINRVTRTFLWPGLVHKNRQPNIASLLKEKAGYEVVWKGKWHLSYASNAVPGNGGEDWTAADIKVMEENYGWSGWNPPDAGNAIERWQPTQFGKFNGLATLGGGRLRQRWTLRQRRRCRASRPDAGLWRERRRLSQKSRVQTGQTLLPVRLAGQSA